MELLETLPEVDGYKVLNGKYLLFEVLGKGGMGTVYRGRHVQLEREVAIKCLAPELAQRDPGYVQRFQREAKAAARLSCENVVGIYDVDTLGELHYIVLEYVLGESARERVQRKGPLDIDEACAIALGTAKGLSTAHQAGLVHRDVKPDNVLISETGEVKLADLGLAKVVDESSLRSSQRFMGTPLYAPPEQFESFASVGPSADVYSLGAALYYLLVGSDGIKGRSLEEVYRAVTNEPFPRPRAQRPEIPEELDELIASCVRKQPDSRPSIKEVISGLQRIQGVAQRDLMDPGARSRPFGAVDELIAVQRASDGRRSSASGDDRAPTFRRIAFGSVAVLSLAGLAYMMWGGATEPEVPHPELLLFESERFIEPYLTRETTLDLSGTVQDKREATLFVVDGIQRTSYELDSSGAFDLSYPLLEDRRYDLRLETPGLDSPLTLKVIRDATAPEVLSVEPTEETVMTGGEMIDVTVAVDDPLASASYAGTELAWSREALRGIVAVPVDQTRWPVDVRVQDELGNSSTLRLTYSVAPAAARDPDKDDEDPNAGDVTTPPTKGGDTPAPAGARAPMGWEVVDAQPPDGAPAQAPGPARKAGWAWRVRDPKTDILFILVEPGAFDMGSPADEPMRSSVNDWPLHRVELSQPFYLAQYELTQAQFEGVMGHNPSRFDSDAKRPVESITPLQADYFCQSFGYVLPSEAQWEYACRAGTQTPFHTGMTLTPEQARIDQDFDDGPVPFGTFDPNPWGFYDMHGNVQEICADKMVTRHETGARIDPFFPPKRDDLRLARGGNFDDSPRTARSANRTMIQAESGNHRVGFRVAYQLTLD